jgi:hypothetical protein
MLNEELIDKIRQTVAACEAHNARMKSAIKRLSHLFPLTESRFVILTEDEVSYTDQLILRFLKLQDLMGQRLFSQILLLLQEDYSSRPMVDVINRLEQLHIIDSAEKWVELKEVRNLITHDYPHMTGEFVDGLNQLSTTALELSVLFEKISGIILKRIN